MRRMTGRRMGSRVLSSLAIAFMLAGCSASATPTPTPTGTHAPNGSMTLARTMQTATLLADGRVLIAGGCPDLTNWPVCARASAEIYDPKTGTFSPTGSLIFARSEQTATLLADGRVLIAGGSSGGTTLAWAELYDPKTGTFSATGSMTNATASHTATLLSDGRVLVAGGGFIGASPIAFTGAQIYDLATGKFSPTGSMTAGRLLFTATLLSDGRVLVAGGCGSSGSFNATAEIYDPKTGTFSPTGSMATARCGATATLLSNGDVLVAGGSPDGNEFLATTVLASAEIYDPKTGTFSPTGTMAAEREDHTATLLADGRVLITGGLGSFDSGLTSAEIYDLKTGTFSATGSMATARANHTATLLADGRVLITGGDIEIGLANASAELYDPKTGTFSPTGA